MCPRGRETDVSAGRKAWRFYFALLRLEARTAACAIAVVCVTLGAFALAEGWTSGMRLERGEAALIVLSLVAAGGLVHAALGHHRPVARLALLAGVSTIAAAIPTLVWIVRNTFAAYAPKVVPTGVAYESEWGIAIALGAGLSFVAMVAGYPLGALMRWIGGLVRSARWRGRLSRARARRFAT